MGKERMVQIAFVVFALVVFIAIQRLFKRKKHSNTTNVRYEPIVFMNSPISNDKNDVIGINPAVCSIKEAINKDAKLIGIIADYGSGKSSLTETLAKDKKSFGKAIHINMWDSISKLNDQKNEDDAINLLTKSFVFQLASGVSEHCAKHVNRRLSKNYGIISFSISSWQFWIWTIVASISYILYAGITLLKIEEIEKGFALLTNRLSADIISTLSVGIKASAPLFMVLGIILAIIGLRKTTVAFSQWKSNAPRELEINDIFEAYIYIHKKLLSFRHHRLIIVEDLDRIENKSLVVGFLKEIYRFSSLSLHKWRKEPAFLISVMAESHLKPSEKSPPAEQDEKEVYSKLFDYTITLKPIHFTDYAEILLNIIGDEHSENRQRLETLLGYKDSIINNQLPKSFDWIVTGHNLTIRQLKDRLNSAVSLLVSLKNKAYRNQSYIDFSSCSAVAYLEHQYPKLFGELIRNEEIFADLVRETYKIKNSNNGSIETMVNEKLRFIKPANNIEDGSELESFKNDISKMLESGNISDDFRMYFYSFPKNSYIKNSDERDICNLLLLPNDYPYDEELEEKLNRVSYKDDIIIETIEKISNDININHYPKIIFEDWRLLKFAYNVNSSKVKNSISYFALWDNEHFEESGKILALLLSYYDLVPNELWNYYSQALSIKFYSIDTETRIKIRKQIILIVANKIELFEGLFNKRYQNDNIKPDFTIITEEELSLMQSKEIATLMINTSLIDESNFKYIIDHINSFKSYDIPYLFTKTTEIISSIVTNVDIDLCWKECIEFLKNNSHVDDELFVLIASVASKTPEGRAIIGNYLSSLPPAKITEKYLKTIEKEMFDEDLSQDICNLLYANKLFTALLSYSAKKHCFNFIDFVSNENQQEVLDAIEKLLNFDVDLIPVIRCEIIKQYLSNSNLAEMNDIYKELYYNDYPKITKDEMELIPDITIILGWLNRTKVTIDNFREVVVAINEKAKPEQCMEIFDLLLNTDYEDNYSDNTIVINLLNKLDYRVLGVSKLVTEDMKTLTDLVGKYQDFSNSANAINFMEKAECLFPELEKIVAGAKTEDYIELINKIDAPSEFTFSWLDKNDVNFKLPHNVLLGLLRKKLYKKYLVGKVLFENTFTFPYLYVPDDLVAAEYRTKSPIWPYVQSKLSLINYIIRNKVYENFDEKELLTILPFLCEGKQSFEFTKYILDKLSKQMALKYLMSMGEIVDDENSLAISKLLIQPPYISLLEDDEIFNAVKERLWEDVDSSFKGYKSSFTRKRNEHFRK